MKAAAFTLPHESLCNDFRGKFKSMFVPTPRRSPAPPAGRPPARTHTPQRTGAKIL
jgi:hypothetical protein